MNNKIRWVDCTRITASFLVVLIHSAAPLVYEYRNITPLNWWAANVYDSIARVCVPLYFMITGYLLLGKQESMKEYITKRVNKILYPLLAWSVFFILWKHYVEHSETVSLRSFYSLFLAPTYFHLWFFYIIIGLYLYIPILRALVQQAQAETLYYFTGLWFFAAAVFPLIERTTSLQSQVDLKMISGYVGYLVVGYLLGNIQNNKLRLVQVALIAIIFLMITTAGTYLLIIRNKGEFGGYFYDYLSPNVILYSAALFVMFKHLFERANISAVQERLIQALSSASFGIYLIHVVILYILKAGWMGFALSAFSFNAIYSVPLTAILAFTLSFTIVFLMQKIPLVRKFVP